MKPRKTTRLYHGFKESGLPQDKIVQALISLGYIAPDPTDSERYLELKKLDRDHILDLLSLFNKEHQNG